MIKSEVISGLIASGIPLLMNGTPESVMFAAGVQPILKEAFDSIIPDIFHKNLTKREIERLGISYKAAVEQINENVQHGISLRGDDLFIRSDSKYSKADDIIEAVLKNTINDTERKKAEFYGYFFGNLAFCPEIDYSNALHYQRIISQLSYTHLCLIRYLHLNNNIAASGWKEKINRNNNLKWMEIYHALKELVSLDLTITIGGISLGEEINTVKLNIAGQAVNKIMGLHKISNDDFNEISNIINQLRS